MSDMELLGRLPDEYPGAWNAFRLSPWCSLKDYPHIRTYNSVWIMTYQEEKAVKNWQKNIPLWAMRSSCVFRLWEKIITLLQYAKENQELSFHIQKGKNIFTERKRTEIQKTENLQDTEHSTVPDSTGKIGRAFFWIIAMMRKV